MKCSFTPLLLIKFAAYSEIIVILADRSLNNEYQEFKSKGNR